MSKLVIVITPLLDDGHRLAEEWQKAGAPGVTYLEGYGLRRLQEQSKGYEVLPGMMSMLEILRQTESHNLMIISLVPNDNLVDRLLEIAQDILGDLQRANNGIAFVLDVERTLGIRSLR